MVRPPEHLLIPASVVVPMRAAHRLSQWLGLEKLRTQWRGRDPEIDAVLLAFHTASISYERYARGTTTVTQAQPEPALEWLDPQRAASRLGIGEAAVRKACREGRLAAEKRDDGHWYIRPEELKHYEAARRARRAP